MVNCGRCGRPIYGSAEPVCNFCKKTITRGATQKAARMNKRQDMETEMFMNIASPGGEETEDATSIWADEIEDAKKGKRRKS